MAKKDKYSKPGKGITKNQPEKRAFFLFWELYFSKFWNLLKINIIMFACLTPVLMALTFPSHWSYVVALLILEAVILGPCICGVSYLFRNICAKSHIWVWSDFKDVFADNYKYGVIIGCIDIVLLWLLYVANNYYTKIIGGTVGDVISAVITVFFALFVMMNMYVYPMIVTFSNNLISHLKNALVFTLANLPRSVLAFILDGVVIVGLGYVCYCVIPMPISIFVALALGMFFVPAFVGFLNMFIVWPVLKPHLNLKEKEESEEETIFSDELIIKDEEGK